MTTLLDVSLKRLAASMPDFPGQSLPEQLAAGRAAAEAALRRYVPNFAFNEADARSVLFDVGSWAERNQDALGTALDPDKNPTNTLPAELELRLGAVKTQQFILASFTVAAAGLGPWNAGEVARVAAGAGTIVSDTLIDSMWAKSDASIRLDTFKTIVAMEQRGDLKLIFQPDQAMSGLGALAPIYVVILIATAIFAASVVVYLIASKAVTKNNDLMRDLCQEAQRQGRDDVVKACIEATRDLQEGWGTSIGKEVAKGIVVFGGMYLAVKYALPELLQRWGKGRSPKRVG